MTRWERASPAGSHSRSARFRCCKQPAGRLRSIFRSGRNVHHAVGRATTITSCRGAAVWTEQQPIRGRLGGERLQLTEVSSEINLHSSSAQCVELTQRQKASREESSADERGQRSNWWELMEPTCWVSAVRVLMVLQACFPGVCWRICV